MIRTEDIREILVRQHYKEKCNEDKHIVGKSIFLKRKSEFVFLTNACHSKVGWQREMYLHRHRSLELVQHRKSSKYLSQVGSAPPIRNAGTYWPVQGLPTAKICVYVLECYFPENWKQPS